MLNPTGRIKIFLLLSWSNVGKTTYVHIRYDSFNYILTAFLNILSGDLRALPLEEKKKKTNKTTKTNQTKILFEFFFSDSPVTHTSVALCFI